MVKVNFDYYAENYDEIIQEQLKFFGEHHEYFAEYKIKIVCQILNRHPGKILEYGCGTGRNLPYFAKYFPDSEIYGCDISEKSLSIAQKKYSQIRFFLLQSEMEPRNSNFDLIFVAGVFHHVEPQLRESLINEINRLLKSKGDLVVFEQNPYNPVTRYMVHTCPFDADAILVKPKELSFLFNQQHLNVLDMKYTLFFPAFLNKIRFLEKYLGWIPFGGQYYIHVRKENDFR